MADLEQNATVIYSGGIFQTISVAFGGSPTFTQQQAAQYVWE